MFERNKVDNAVNDTKNGVPAEITLADGDMLVGKIVISAGRNVFDQLNGRLPSSRSSRMGPSARMS